MSLQGITLYDYFSQAVPAHVSGGILIEEVLEFLALLFIEKEAIRTDELQSVPLGRIMAGGDRHSAAASLGHQLHGRRRTDAHVEDILAD